MKVLLISANRLKFPYPVYPLGLDYLSDALLASDHTVKIADMNAIGDFDALGGIIRSFLPDVIGVSIRNIDNTDSIAPENFISGYQELIRHIRNASDAVLVLGGSGFTLFPSEIMSETSADFGVVGEGEETFVLLSEALEKNKPANAIPGVITKQSFNTAHLPSGKLFPRYFHEKNSHVNYYLKNGGMLNLQTKRGCPFKCVYCTYPHIEGSALRLVSPEDAAKTARRLQETGAKYFYITDSLFNSDDDHCIRIARAFVKAGVRIPWGAFFGPKTPSKDFYRMLADAGLTHVEFGTESFSDAMLTSLKKPFRREDVFKAHQAAADAGLHIAHFLMPGGPGETPDTLNETLSSVRQLKKCVVFIFCGIRIYPNTGLYKIALDQGQITPDQNLLTPVFYSPESISLKDIIREVEIQSVHHPNRVIGSDVKNTEKILSRMYSKGYSGPLWEKLIR